MTHTQASLSADDSTSLAYQYWLPQTPVKAVVAFLHGVGGHSGQPTYRYLIDYLVNTSRAVYGLDLRGFGHSAGRRGHTKKWQVHIDDVSAFMATVRTDQPDKPLFLFGQSLGGLIALEYAIETEGHLDGIIVSAPAVAHPEVPAWLPPIVRALANVAPTLPLKTKIDVEACSRDRSEVVKLQADPLHYPKVTARFVVEFDDAVSRVEANAHRINLPLLVLVGSADSIIPPQASRDLYDAVGGEDKTLKIYEGGYHQPILDTNRDEVLSDIGAWISTHTASTASSN